ncbi:hypothetical protein [Gemmatimonas sp.]|uniref:phage scaffolding protein n=1 Tax=Gemmatimonas sp. TaxID=1962908 RepID=UPI003567C7F2
MTTEITDTGTEGTEPAGTEITPPAWTAPATQADLDRIINERLTRERAKFADYDTVKARATKLDEIEAANLSDLDKANAARDAAETRATEREATANRKLIKAAVTTAVAGKTADGVTADDIIGYLGELTVTDDGDIDGLTETIEALLEAKAFLKSAAPAAPTAPVTTTGATNPARNSNAGQITDISGMSPPEIAQALAEGRLDSLLG